MLKGGCCTCTSSVNINPFTSGVLIARAKYYMYITTDKGITKYIYTQSRHYIHTCHKKAAAQNEVALNFHRMRRLYFLTAVFDYNIISTTDIINTG